MGIHAKAQPGDMAIIVSGNTRLWEDNPEILGHTWNNHDSVSMMLEAGTHCVILRKVEAGSSKKGHVFMVLAQGRIGWVWNYDLMVWPDLA